MLKSKILKNVKIPKNIKKKTTNGILFFIISLTYYLNKE